MKIALALYSLDIGGSEILGKNLAFALKEHGHIPSVYAIDHDGELSGELNQYGISTIVINRKPGEYIGTMWRVWQSFRKYQPDVVHTHHLHVLVYCFLAAKLVGARLVHTEHEYFSLLSSKKKLMLRILSLFCDRVTGVEDAVTAFLTHEVGVNPKKVLTIRNGIDLQRFTGPSSLSRASLGICGTEPIIGIVARLEPVKDHVTLLEAFARIREEHAVRLLIVGDGSMRKTLEQECHRLGIVDFVTFTGARRDIPNLLKIMDIFVLCSREEGLPIALLEAMAAAKPIVATNVGSIPKVIQHRKTGLLVPPRMSEDLAQSILYLLDNHVLIQQLGASAQSLIQQEFCGNHMLEAYIRMYSRG